MSQPDSVEMMPGGILVASVAATLAGVIILLARGAMFLGGPVGHPLATWRRLNPEVPLPAPEPRNLLFTHRNAVTHHGPIDIWGWMFAMTEIFKE